VLLFRYGLGQGDGGPWRARLGHTIDSPYELVHPAWWAIVHDRVRVRLLVERGGHLTRSAHPEAAVVDAHLDGRADRVAALAGCPGGRVAGGPQLTRPPTGPTR
jgi:hypothetical protein